MNITKGMFHNMKKRKMLFIMNAIIVADNIDLYLYIKHVPITSNLKLSKNKIKSQKD